MFLETKAKEEEDEKMKRSTKNCFLKPHERFGQQKQQRQQHRTLLHNKTTKISAKTNHRIHTNKNSNAFTHYYYPKAPTTISQIPIQQQQQQQQTTKKKAQLLLFKNYTLRQKEYSPTHAKRRIQFFFLKAKANL